MITEEEQIALYIDWFFTDGEQIGFVASGGGLLPATISKSSENIKILSAYFWALPKRCGAILNTNLTNKIKDITECYLSAFVPLSEKGLYSFDKTFLNRPFDTSYHLVAKPITPLRLQDLPLQIKNIVIETKLKSRIEDDFDIAALFIK
jgi:hypothetical protein